MSKELVERIAEQHILLIRDVENNTSLKCPTHRDVDRIVMANKMFTSYGEAVDNLILAMDRYNVKNKNLRTELHKLKEEVINNPVKELRIGLVPANKPQTEEEMKLDRVYLIKKLEMLANMVSIKEASEIVGIGVTTIKMAATEERLKNIKKSGKVWLVNLIEVEKYWGKEIKVSD